MAEAPITHHTALVYLMVLSAAADSEMTDAELENIGQSVRELPIFSDYDRAMLVEAARSCADVLAADDGLTTVLGLVKSALPASLVETGYALACDIAVGDGHLTQEELRLLELIRHELGIDRLTAAAIERGIAALNRTLPTD